MTWLIEIALGAGIGVSAIMGLDSAERGRRRAVLFWSFAMVTLTLVAIGYIFWDPAHDQS